MPASRDEAMVKVATRHQSEQVVDALVLAFARDPVARFAFPEPTQHRAGFSALVLAMGGAALDHSLIDTFERRVAVSATGVAAARSAAPPRSPGRARRPARAA